ncbi:PAS domain-containing protein [Lutimaribacter sp. EGI FJ00015]|uniref:PAS domain-containing protein n=1 Tax=Lutimaribacter degradans TaxID=2945989 RepID=A0ACC5ZT01_9RHOB|nr:PAS domain-containing protein [Lutimaribacter sp. EGI FJ00013]MCM2561078.1 PAS domain-containing protein [Lutimaribacter sp. EGI FJ00013]MCO0611973.1 PAS domain-containing protein [Lutimaribacter sp. EGI FJ00015]MCO0634906.1 PAS domain-containing protein [Lutimaribacter sp. EGI FJ00014]
MKIVTRHNTQARHDTGRGATICPTARPGPGTSHMAQVEAYWTALYRDGQPPARAQIDPRGIEGSLEHAFVAERITPGEARLRVGGSHLSALLGMEVRGMPLSALIAPAARQKLAETLQQVFDTPAIGRVTLHARGSRGQPELHGRLLLLPLRGDGSAVNRLLGCLVSDGARGSAPRRFDIRQAHITPARGAGPAHAATQTGPAHRPPGLAEAATGFARPHPDAPHLRLVTTD